MSKPLHILVINVFFAPHSYGGATIVAEQVARRLVADHGVRVTAISGMSRADLPAYATLRTEVAGIQNILINLPPGRGYVEHYANPQVAARIAEIARGVAPDIAHLHCLQEIGADAVAALKAQGLPVILSTHDFWWLCERQFMLRPDGRYCGQDPIRIDGCRGCAADLGAARTRFEALGMLGGLADIVTCPSDFALGLHARSGFARDKLRVWTNGVRLPGPGFGAAQAARRAADPRLVFGYVGGPSAIKGWPLMRTAFGTLGRSDFRGILVDGSLEQRWWTERHLRALQGEWSIHPRYDQEAIDDFFAKIDVLVFLSQWKETFGLTVREALARGVRVIQTDAGGAIEHGAHEAVRVVPIGCDPRRLRAEILAELGVGARGCAPVEVQGYAAQAQAFLEMAEGLTRRPMPQSGAA